MRLVSAGTILGWRVLWLLAAGNRITMRIVG
jgi:hypothetical protein